MFVVFVCWETTTKKGENGMLSQFLVAKSFNPLCRLYASNGRYRLVSTFGRVADRRALETEFSIPHIERTPCGMALRP